MEHKFWPSDKHRDCQHWGTSNTILWNYLWPRRDSLYCGSHYIYTVCCASVCYALSLYIYRKFSNIRRTRSQNLNVSHLILQLFLCNILKPGAIYWSQVLGGYRPICVPPATSEWSTIVLPTKVWLILEVWLYFKDWYTGTPAIYDNIVMIF